MVLLWLFEKQATGHANCAWLLPEGSAGFTPKRCILCGCHLLHLTPLTISTNSNAYPATFRLYGDNIPPHTGKLIRNNQLKALIMDRIRSIALFFSYRSWWPVLPTLWQYPEKFKLKYLTINWLRCLLYWIFYFSFKGFAQRSSIQWVICSIIIAIHYFSVLHYFLVFFTCISTPSVATKCQKYNIQFY